METESRITTIHLKILLLTFLLLLSSCIKVGPDYKDPSTKVAKHWARTSSKQNAIVKEGALRTAQWWRVFNDDNLNQLIAQGHLENLNLQMAGTRVLQARAILAQTTGELYPQQQAMSGDISFYRTGGSFLQNILPSTYITDTIGVGVNWELDFWGKYRRAIESENGAFLSSVAAYDAALVTLLADIASTYIRYRTNEALTKVTRENIQIQTRSLKIAQARYYAGETSALDVNQATTQLAQTKAQLPSQVAQMQVAKHKLAVLLGLPPTEIQRYLSRRKSIPIAPTQIEVAIPRTILLQRPDVMQARYKAMAQSAAIGEIKALLFPAFSLSGSFSFSSNNIFNSSLSDIFNWSNRIITGSSFFNWPILNYGQITNAVRAQDAAFQEALLNFQQTVLRAQQEVQDGISQYLEAKNEVHILQQGNRAAVESTRLSLIRYTEGESNYTTVIEAQRQQLTLQSTLMSSKGNLSQAVVALFRAMGGGWQIRQGTDIIPLSIKCAMTARTNWGSLLQPENHLPPTDTQQQFKQMYIPTW